MPFSCKKQAIREIDGCPMGGLISVVLSDIYVCNIEEDIVAPSKCLFYKGYVDDTYVKRKKYNRQTLQCIHLVPPKYKLDFRTGSNEVH